jgi:sterol desaturase/sphingolipid hydroxylase (fatty acid hydroxylase superfamily)
MCVSKTKKIDDWTSEDRRLDPHEISNDPVAVRLFKSDSLEFFTHISPLAVTILWLPVTLLFITAAILNRRAFSNPLLILVAFLLGVLLWTFSEYMLHRFVFHFKPRNAWQERASFMFHGVHHYQPRIKTRLVMPPALSIPLALIFFTFFWLVFGLVALPHWTAPVFSGFILGYLLYDLTHYATHHWPMPFEYYKFLKRYHMNHHYKTPNARFGVTSPVWDMVFGTKPAD